MVTIRDVLNKLKWTNQINNYIVVYVSRGSPNNEEVVELSRVIMISKDGFTYISNRGRETYIPYHRVIEIRHRDGTVIFHRNVPH
ncbi:DUF504 domain-containing protein [Vulcanisaeta souniana]|uniref:MJ1316 RNA cyclic group end recognition domain-containing protein n=1 Tax=Vulcanisaeta souniana JCM 11219 TaxID=1293586 RepID=A0A830E6Z3_9CREN|nr:DUF504 domain-containing protein [Vulcanisaeta souniana]BDR93523.1 hypothetical protein Vsou_26160 [Vulcanisaeta souniana JCM 11219]GGI77826.1 hypothetical protein GCM10007112_13280 [Vulcanisaeta souniana JCM 11219]